MQYLKYLNQKMSPIEYETTCFGRQYVLQLDTLQISARHRMFEKRALRKVFGVNAERKR
jgi:hypothetical protein